MESVLKFVMRCLKICHAWKIYLKKSQSPKICVNPTSWRWDWWKFWDSCVWSGPRFYVRENRWLVTDEPVEVRDSRRITGHVRGIYRICLKLNEWKQNRKMSTCNWLDLESHGSWPTIKAQKLPGHYWFSSSNLLESFDFKTLTYRNKSFYKVMCLLPP